MTIRKRYALGAALAIIAGAAYAGSFRGNIPSDLRDAPKAYEELTDFSGPSGGPVPPSPEPLPFPAEWIAEARGHGAYGIAINSSVPDYYLRVLLLDLDFLGGIRPNNERPTSLHAKIFGQVHGADYLRYLRAGVREIRMEGNNEEFMAGVYGWQPSVIVLTPSLFREPEIGRIATYIHENRHTGKLKTSWAHVKCPEDFSVKEYRRKWICDNTVLGAYGAECIMLKNIHKGCANCGGKMRMDAELYFQDTCDRILTTEAQTALWEDIGRYSVNGNTYGSFMPGR